MSRPNAGKCCLCAKLAIAQAHQRHGSEETGCWDASRCHQHRSYYRHRELTPTTGKLSLQQGLSPQAAIIGEPAPSSANPHNPSSVTLLWLEQEGNRGEFT